MYSGEQPLRYPGPGAAPYGGHGQPFEGQTNYSGGQQSSYNPGGWAAGAADSEVMLWFQAVDVDQSGRITAAELRQALTNGNWSLFSEDACRLMIGMFDYDQSKSIDLQEFQQLWRYLQEWQRVFSQTDHNNSGYIEQAELQQALSSMGYQLSPTFIQLAIGRFDHLRQNRLTLDSFITCCAVLHQLTELFKQKDVERKGEIRVNYDDFLGMALTGMP